jgi:cell division protein FtsL
MSGRLCLLLTVILVACSLLLVNSQYQARRLFIELERKQAQARQLDLEWSQLELDQSTLGQSARIASLAASNLQMMTVVPNRVQYLIAGDK